MIVLSNDENVFSHVCTYTPMEFLYVCLPVFVHACVRVDIWPSVLLCLCASIVLLSTLFVIACQRFESRWTQGARAEISHRALLRSILPRPAQSTCLLISLSALPPLPSAPLPLLFSRNLPLSPHPSHLHRPFLLIFNLQIFIILFFLVYSIAIFILLVFILLIFTFLILSSFSFCFSSSSSSFYSSSPFLSPPSSYSTYSFFSTAPFSTILLFLLFGTDRTCISGQQRPVTVAYS